MIYLVYGEQFPLVKKRVRKLIRTLLPDGEDEFNSVRLNAKEVTVQDIVYECSLLPFGARKVVRVDNPYFLGSVKERIPIEKDQDYDALLGYIANSNAVVDLIFVLESKTVNKKSEIYKAIEKKGKILFEEGLSPEVLAKTGKVYFEKKGVRITQEALDLLLERVGNNVTGFIQEAEKLALYKKEIDVDDVHLMVNVPPEQNAFLLCDALIGNRIGKAISVFRDLTALKEEPVRLIALLAGQFRLHACVAYLYTKEKRSQEEIASQLNVHPYRVKLMCRNLVRISYDRLIEVTERLYALDLKIKAMEIDATTGLELFLVRFPSVGEKNR